MGGKETGSKQIHPVPGITCLLGQRAQTQGWHEVRPQHWDRLIGSRGGQRTGRTALEKHSSAPRLRNSLLWPQLRLKENATGSVWQRRRQTYQHERPRAESKGPIPFQLWGMLRLLAEGSTDSFVTLLL